MDNTVKFFGVNDFKALVGLHAESKLDIVRNPNTGLLFMSLGDKAYKCQQAISKELPIKVIVPLDAETGELDIDNACLSNVKETTNNVMFSL